MSSFLDLYMEKYAKNEEDSQPDREILDYIKEKICFCVADIQVELGLDYRVVDKAVESLVQNDLVVYETGAMYRYVHKKETKEAEKKDVSAEPFPFSRYLNDRSQDFLNGFWTQKAVDTNDADDDELTEFDEDDPFDAITRSSWQESICNFNKNLRIWSDYGKQFAALPDPITDGNEITFELIEVNDCIYASDRGMTVAALKRNPQFDRNRLNEMVRNTFCEYGVSLADEELWMEIVCTEKTVMRLLRLYIVMRRMLDACND